MIARFFNWLRHRFVKADKKGKKGLHPDNPFLIL